MKKFCLSRSISQEPYIIWLSFMVQMCKMIISPGCFFNFSKFWFSWCQRDWKGKKRPKMTKNYVCLTLISRTIHQNDDTSSHFFYFSKFWFQNDLKLPISVCFAHLRSNRLCSHDVFSFNNNSWLYKLQTHFFFSSSYTACNFYFEALSKVFNTYHF